MGMGTGIRSRLRKVRLARWASRKYYRHQRDHPPTPKPGWVIAPPDFVGVGVQKAGTTWWYELLAAHPRISHHGRPKELHYWDRLWEHEATAEDIATYHSHFPRPPGQLSGEWTPGYMASFWIPAALRAAAPDAKLLVLLRDPVERYRSALTMVGSNLSFPLSATHAREAFSRGFYADQLEHLYALFPVEQVLVMQYEQVKEDPRPHLARTFEFLGVDPSFVPTDLHEQRNITPGVRLELTDAMRRTLITNYEPDVKRLTQLVPDLDLARWPSFQHLA